MGRLTVCLLALVLSWPVSGHAQGLGLGPRLAFVRGDVPTGAPSTRFVGGTLRLRSSRRVVLEVAVDYRTELAEDGASRLRERPIQGSMLVFPFPATFAPYLLAGFGLYSRTTDTLDAQGLTVSSTNTRETGAHLGFGAELSVTRHTALFADYRYRFVRFGTPAADSEPISIPGLSSVKLSHRGSMWTSGVAFYF